MIDIVAIIIPMIFFILIIIATLFEKVDKTLVSITAGLLTVVFVILWYNFSFGDVLLKLVSGDDLGYLEIYLLIIGMNIITNVLYDSGVFQFVALKTVKITKGNKILMLLIFGVVAVFISSFISNILTIFILAPITILFTGVLKIDAEPYLILEVIMVNVGGLITLISSNLNILVCSLFDINFIEFFLYFAPLGLILIFVTILLSFLILRKRLKTPEKKQVKYLQQFDDWSIVKDKKRFYRASIMFIITMIFFILFSEYLGLISVLSGFLMIIFVVKDKKSGISNINMNTLIYFAGFFITLEGLKLSGVFELLGSSLVYILPEDPFLISIIILWLTGGISSMIVSIPIALAFSPIVENLVYILGNAYTPILVVALISGTNLGDNLFPVGNVAIKLDIIEQNGSQKIKMKNFFKLGFIVAIIQLIITTFYLFLLI
ncbi:MAG: hypothetical protein EU549_03820 [Promethearchaeota archaeon]|nr:MAG: hypothetical protein EU549_03820 [Candidatus Lokiarchaeota archaeon]